MSRRPNIEEALAICAREGETLAKVHSRDTRRSCSYEEVVAQAEKRAAKNEWGEQTTCCPRTRVPAAPAAASWSAPRNAAPQTSTRGDRCTCGARGEPISSVEAGLPERMIAFGFKEGTAAQLENLDALFAELSQARN